MKLSQIKKSIAFTLAETLVVMGIIGVVAALTLPNLNSSTGDKEKVAKLKKIYQNINDAYERAVAVYGPVTEWCPSTLTQKQCTSKCGDRITEFMKISKTCGLETNKGCFYKDVYRMDKSETENSADSSDTYMKYILADGSSFALTKTNSILGFDVDIDGPNKGQSRYNDDYFIFDVSLSALDKGIRPVGEDTVNNYTNYARSQCNSDAICTNWVLRFDNLDYLKADASGKCPNNVQLNWQTQTSCK